MQLALTLMPKKAASPAAPTGNMDIKSGIRFGYFKSWSGGAYQGMSLVPSYRSNGLMNMASFGLFDGHTGTFAADLCAKELHENVIDNFVALSRAALQGDEQMDHDDRVDALMCESITRGYKNMHEYARKTDPDDSGTCALSMFLIRNGDGATRVLCANAGDSRCVLYGKKFEGVRYIQQTKDTTPSTKSPRVHAFPMSEDHRVGCLRERTRVLGKTRLADTAWLNRPITTFVSLPANVVAYEHGSDAGVCPTFELGYPDRDRITAADLLLESLNKSVVNTYNPRRAFGDFVFESMLPSFSERTSKSNSFDQGDTASMYSRSSYVKNDTIVGSRGGKVRTTRSIGDKNGPKGLIAVPEISGLVIEPTESARFVLAYRSFWDHITEEEMQSAMASNKRTSAKDLAIALGAMASARIAEAGKNLQVSLVVVEILKSETRSSGRCVLS